MPKLNQSIETEIINEDGEFISKRANRTLSWGAEPSFIKFYLQDILYISDMPKKHYKILCELLKRATYAGDKDGMQVCLSAGMKRIIAKALNYKSTQPIDNALSELSKGKILYRVETGVYQFNPYLFGKGDWQDIARLRLEINYDDIKGKTFRAVCEYQEPQEEPESIVPNIAEEPQEYKQA